MARSMTIPIFAVTATSELDSLDHPSFPKRGMTASFTPAQILRICLQTISSGQNDEAGWVTGSLRKCTSQKLSFWRRFKKCLRVPNSSSMRPLFVGPHSNLEVHLSTMDAMLDVEVICELPQILRSVSFCMITFVSRLRFDGCIMVNQQKVAM